MGIELTRKIDKILKHIANTADDWMTLKEVCAYCKLSPSTLRRNIISNRIKSSKTTGKYLFRRSWINEFLGE